MESLFDACMWLLLGLADATGLDYETVNVLLFVFAWPACTLYLAYQLLQAKQELWRVTGTRGICPRKAQALQSALQSLATAGFIILAGLALWFSAPAK